MAFTDVFRLHARHQGSKAALIGRGRSLDYRTLDRLIDGTAHALAAIGLRRGEVIGVALRDHIEHLVLILAMARLGAVMLPLDCRWNAQEKQSVATHFGVTRAIVEVDDPALQPGWLTADAGWFVESDTSYHDPEVLPDSPMLLSLSSGTSGTPKGPLSTHRVFEARFMVYWINLRFNSSDVFIAATPLYFGGGRGFTLGMMFAGATVHLCPPPFQPEELVAYTNTVGGTAMFLVPTMLRRLLQADLPAPALPGLQKLISSGSALFAAERDAIRSRLTDKLFELYSSTEGGSASVLVPEDYAGHSESVGRPCFRVEMEVVDSEHRKLPPGQVGRLRYRSPASATSFYVGDGSEAFHEGWYYPGDLGEMDADGYVFLRGRSKDMIIRGGVNIYPGDVETVLARVPGVAEVAVIGIPSIEFGEEVAAFVVAPPEVTDARLMAECQQALAKFKWPKKFLRIDALPRNAGGKVVKSELALLVPRA